MKSFTYILMGLMVALASTACEKVIDVDLEETDRVIVIEAALSEGTQDFQVNISKTTNYFGASEDLFVPDATVVLADDEGTTWPIDHVGEGVYVAPVTAMAGRTYTLTVEAEGETYTAISRLLQPVTLDSLTIEFQEPIGAFEGGYLVFLNYQDPAGVSNFYRALHERNGELQTGPDFLQLWDDGIVDGTETRLPLFNQFFEVGDTVMVEMRHLDEPVYDYYETLSAIIGTGGGGGSGVAAPANPNTNWTGNAQGHFSTYSSSYQTMIVE
ncbi:DUF4249 domain-containing protein [Pontibacter sp. G13]|uniref:DUF4249 domain-containing protein n=1 Tax=Pontibacter sp. G13 TaxID=3074898 RepID=UPI002889F8FA|nr:DUF4249 domain-containing protein [Pontibacter sp. G13]WNJ18459.1 DUF4249 domain-containing protein [Pontibacter sp. G13]